MLSPSVHKKLNRPGYPVAAIDRLVSVVMSVADEQGNVLPLAAELTNALQAIPQAKNSYEIIFVDDQSTDATREEIMEAMRQFPHIRLISHQGRYGKSQGVWTGLRNARGAWIVTMDGDGQNDPADIKKLLDVAWKNGVDANVLISGVRVNRQGTNSRKWASRAANALRRAILKDDSPDTGCALKVFRRDAYLALPYFDNIHRYEPTLFRLYHVPVEYVPVNDRARLHGVSKYTNFRRALDGIFDLIGVAWLTRRYKAREEESTEIEVAAEAGRKTVNH